MADITELTKLIDLELLEALYDEWMDAEYFNVTLTGTNISVTDKRGHTNTTDLAAAAKAAKAEWDNTYKPQMNSDHTRAESDHSTAVSDHTASVNATNEASNVNAQLNGFTVTITNRNGVSRSVDIGFEMFKTYTSVSAMNADASNVPQGKFVIIATEDPTSEENARLYCKNSQGSFTFLSDLDQAAAHAFADWMENYKPVIESDHTRAESDHSTADSDHSVALQDHNVATSDHTIATTDHQTAVTDHTTAESDHTRAESDHSTAVTDHTTADSDHTRAESDHTRADTDHTTAVSDTTRASEDHTRAEDDHTRAESDHDRAETDHSTATADHTQSEEDHERYTDDRQTFEDDEAARQQTFEDNEQARQDVFDTNEEQRQHDFEDAEAERMASMVITRCFVDVATMCLMFVQPEKDSTVYKVRNGNLNITVTYE